VGGVTIRDHQFSRLFNFRDLGGQRTADGQSVRFGRVYRSDSLHALTDEDREVWGSLGVRTVLDLRRPREIEKYGRVPEWEGLRWEHVYLRHQPWEEIPWQRGAEPLEDYLTGRYLAMAEESGEDIATALGVVADPDNAPVVVHCMAGKDRTGIICALTLAVLGVPDDDIAEEYALTSPNLQRLREALLASKPGRTDLDLLPLDTPAVAMHRLLAGLRERHGSIEGYLASIGLPDSAAPSMRKHLLE
jgi:protein-tyrosine phosphatase